MSKYHNKKVYINGEKVGDSKKEAARYQELLIMEKAGLISCLRKQVSFPLLPTQHSDGETFNKLRYVADFVYIENGKQVVEDVKAYDKKSGKFIQTPEFKIKRKLMLFFHGINVRLV